MPFPSGVRSEEPRLNSSHVKISYAVFCLKKKKKNNERDKFEKTKKRIVKEKVIVVYTHNSTHFVKLRLINQCKRPITKIFSFLFLKPINQQTTSKLFPYTTLLR